MPVVVDADEGSLTIKDLLAKKPVVAELKEELAELMTDQEQRLTDLATAVGRSPQDGSVRNALGELKDDGRARKGKKGWCK